MNKNSAEQEFKKIFPRLYQQKHKYEELFGIAANKYTMLHQKFYPKHKSNPIITAHPNAHTNSKLITVEKVMKKHAKIYENYCELSIKNQEKFIKKYGHGEWSRLFNKYHLEKYM